MRIADKMALQQVQASLGRNRQEMHNVQEKSASQRRINRPSDDPLGATRVMSARVEEKTQGQFIKSLNIAKDFLSLTDQSLGEISEIISRAKELAISQASEASANESTRRVAANEVEQLLMQTVQVANAKLGDRYLFSGFRTNQAPFNRQGTYKGDDGEIKIQVNKNAYVSMNIPGNKIFLGQQGQDGATDTIEVPKTAEELQDYKLREQEAEEAKSQLIPLAQVYTKSKTQGQRGIASVGPSEINDYEPTSGANVFEVLQSLVNSLQVDDKSGIQGSLDELDRAFDQVLSARAQVGARVTVLNNTLDSLQKNVVDARTRASQIEDADVLQLVNDMNRADTALKATLETSGRLIQPSLLDFLK